MKRIFLRVMRLRGNKTLLKAILLFVLVLPLASLNTVLADDDMTSNLICPCECAMVISTCDCPTAVQIKKEIGSMKEIGFSEEQIVTVLQAEYGRDILVHPEESDSISLWIAGIFLVPILLFLGYIMTKKPKFNIIPDNERYEKQFEEEYQKFVSEMEEA